MVEKIQLVQNRIKELEETLEKARSGRSYADLKWTESLLHLNKKILTQLLHGLPIAFYKLPDQPLPSTRGFFLSKDQVVEPFIAVWN